MRPHTSRTVSFLAATMRALSCSRVGSCSPPCATRVLSARSGPYLACANMLLAYYSVDAGRQHIAGSIIPESVVLNLFHSLYSPPSKFAGSDHHKTVQRTSVPGGRGSCGGRGGRCADSHAYAARKSHPPLPSEPPPSCTPCALPPAPRLLHSRPILAAQQRHEDSMFTSKF